MKNVEEIIPRIISKVNDIAKVANKRIIVETDLKKHIRNSRIDLEELDGLLVELRNSFMKSLGYFPQGGSKILKEVSTDTRNLITKLREWEHRHHKDIEGIFNELKNTVSEKTKEFLDKLDKL